MKKTIGVVIATLFAVLLFAAPAMSAKADNTGEPVESAPTETVSAPAEVPASEPDPEPAPPPVNESAPEPSVPPAAQEAPAPEPAPVPEPEPAPPVEERAPAPEFEPEPAPEPETPAKKEDSSSVSEPAPSASSKTADKVSPQDTNDEGDDGQDDSQVPEKPEAIVEETREERSSCEIGVEYRIGTKTTDYSFDEESGAWIPVEPVIEWETWEFERYLTDEESVELGCPEDPAPEMGDYVSVAQGECSVTVSYVGHEDLDWIEVLVTNGSPDHWGLNSVGDSVTTYPIDESSTMTLWVIVVLNDNTSWDYYLDFNFAECGVVNPDPTEPGNGGDTDPGDGDGDGSGGDDGSGVIDDSNHDNAGKDDGSDTGLDDSDKGSDGKSKDGDASAKVPAAAPEVVVVVIEQSVKGCDAAATVGAKTKVKAGQDRSDAGDLPATGFGGFHSATATMNSPLGSGLTSLGIVALASALGVFFFRRKVLDRL